MGIADAIDALSVAVAVERPSRSAGEPRRLGDGLATTVHATRTDAARQILATPGLVRARLRLGRHLEHLSTARTNRHDSQPQGSSGETWIEDSHVEEA